MPSSVQNFFIVPMHLLQTTLTQIATQTVRKFSGQSALARKYRRYKTPCFIVSFLNFCDACTNRRHPLFVRVINFYFVRAIASHRDFVLAYTLR
jgi:hypothetical protein